jgi:uncharacterized glyoxalase superfamily protein PhnB
MNPQRIVPVFQVNSLESAVKFYEEVLGFEEDFRFGSYAGIKLGAISLHLSEQTESGRSEYKKPVGSGIAYIFCDEVDRYYEQIKTKGAKAMYSPQDFPYGMREFMVIDLDGNHLAFGSEIEDV